MGKRMHYLYKIGDRVTFLYRPKIDGMEKMPKIPFEGVITDRNKSRVDQPVYAIQVTGRQRLMTMHAPQEAIDKKELLIHGILESDIPHLAPVKR